MGLLEHLIISLNGWDLSVQHYIIAKHQPELITLFAWVTSWGNSATIIALCALASAGLAAQRRWGAALILDAGLTAAWITMALLKLWFGRSRPLGEHLVYAGGYSFPSGHAMLSMVLYGFLGYLLSCRLSGWMRWAVRASAGLMILMIGFSRIYLNVHYSSDVIAGFIIGSIFLLLMIWAYSKTDKGPRQLWR